MDFEKDTRPKILRSELKASWKKLYFSSKQRQHLEYGWKIESVINALAILDRPGKFIQPREIKAEIIRNNWFIGADPASEIKTILRFFANKQELTHLGKHRGYQLKYRVLPRPDVSEKSKLNESRNNAYYITRIKQLNGMLMTIVEPQAALLLMGVLADLLIFLDDVKHAANKKEKQRIKNTVDCINAYQKIMAKYVHGQRDRNENLVYRQMIEHLEQLPDLSVIKYNMTLTEDIVQHFENKHVLEAVNG